MLVGLTRSRSITLQPVGTGLVEGADVTDDAAPVLCVKAGLSP